MRGRRERVVTINATVPKLEERRNQEDMERVSERCARKNKVN